MTNKLIITLLLLILTSCTDKIDAERTLVINDFTEIEITGYKILGCSQDDIYHTGFRATSPNGHKVEGVVCKGIFKGSTIRFK
jgi:hypothetical protein